MRIILHSSSFYIIGAIILIGIALTFLFRVISDDQENYVTHTIDRGDVTEIVTVSGFVEAENAAELAFPVTGVVTEIFIEKGSTVERNDVLGTLASAKLVADRLDAIAALERAHAERDELIAGPTTESRSVTSRSIENAERNLARVISEQREKVKNAHRALLSTDLIARTDDPFEEAEPPIVTGSYNCDTEGTYVVDVYVSNAAAGYSYKITGLERGTYDVFVDNPGSFGVCGLSLQFDENSAYSGSTWTIDVPNTRSSSYTTNLNTYELALTQQANAIEAAENTLELARDEAQLVNANPRSEALRRADAAVLQARARIDAIDAQIADRSIVAPFAGVVTEVDILAGETAGAEPVITLLADDSFELTAQIPEIDITKIMEGQRAHVRFDARSEQLVDGIVSFISPVATEIDGVAYFEATVTFTDIPSWIRSGLNADIDIIVEERKNVLRIPKRFVTTNVAERTIILTPDDNVGITEMVIETGFEGNDGYIEITGVPEGTTAIAP